MRIWNRAINEAEENKADLIIFDMHTPGGAVDAAIDIGNRISRTDVETVTFMNSGLSLPGHILHFIRIRFI